MTWRLDENEFIGFWHCDKLYVWRDDDDGRWHTLPIMIIVIGLVLSMALLLEAHGHGDSKLICMASKELADWFVLFSVTAEVDSHTHTISLAIKHMFFWFLSIPSPNASNHNVRANCTCGSIGIDFSSIFALQSFQVVNRRSSAPNARIRCSLFRPEHTGKDWPTQRLVPIEIQGPNLELASSTSTILQKRLNCVVRFSFCRNSCVGGVAWRLWQWQRRRLRKRYKKSKPNDVRRRGTQIEEKFIYRSSRCQHTNVCHQQNGEKKLKMKWTQGGRDGVNSGFSDRFSIRFSFPIWFCVDVKTTARRKICVSFCDFSFHDYWRPSPVTICHMVRACVCVCRRDENDDDKMLRWAHFGVVVKTVEIIIIIQ